MENAMKDHKSIIQAVKIEFKESANGNLIKTPKNEIE